jgi:hypothetical protein
MATYVNDLRLKEIATGDEAGTWGTSTNTNLELIGEALGYGTQDCFASDADATTTVADGASDPARAMYFKVTSSATLTATRTLTIAPNTISRVMLIENATTGSQSITISQGSGSTVTIASGAVKMVYLDGAGAGGAVVEALADLELPTVTVADLTATTADINGGTIDGTVIGGSTPAAITGTTITGTSFVSSGDMTFGDSDKAIFGAGSDLQIYHDGSDSYITHTTGGNFFINDDGAGYLMMKGSDLYFRNPSNVDMIHAQSGGFVKLYHNGVAKLATTATGIDVTGDVTLGDNGKAIFGAGSDLQIYHDGSNSYVQDAGDGALILNTTNGGGVYVYSAGETMATFNSNGAVNLYYDNAAKLATTATGIDVTGTVTADGLAVDGTSTLSATDSATNTVTAGLKVGHNTSGTTANGFGSALEFEAENSTYSTVITNATIESVVTDQVQISSDLNFYTKYNNSLQKRMSFNGGGDISFYEDTGTTAKLFWDASDETISIGTGTSSTATISAFSRTVSASLPSALRIIENTGASTYWDIGSDGGASPNLKFYVNANTTPKVTFTSSGNVDIAGTVTADSLTVDGDATITSASTNSTGFTIGNTAASGVNWTLYSSGGGPTVAGSFGIYNNSTSTNALILSASNNLGLGMAPTTNNISKSISLVNGGSIFGYGSGTYITANSNYNGAWNTVATGPDSRMLLDGNVVFSRSASATAGSAGAVSESMRIDSSGNVGIQGATSITQLPVQEQQRLK